jgi:hypothetical protein
MAPGSYWCNPRCRKTLPGWYLVPREPTGQDASHLVHRQAAVGGLEAELRDKDDYAQKIEDARVEFNQPAKQYSENKTKQLWQHAAKRTKKAG